MTVSANDLSFMLPVLVVLFQIHRGWFINTNLVMVKWMIPIFKPLCCINHNWLFPEFHVRLSKGGRVAGLRN